MSIAIIVLPIVSLSVLIPVTMWADKKLRERWRLKYYEYLKSDTWKRKRHVALKRDNWTCHYCGSWATQVHPSKYAISSMGREPVDWLVSVCESCRKSRLGYTLTESTEPIEHEVNILN